MSNTLNIAIAGGGIVGLSIAVWLQYSGHQVSVFDPIALGTGTSFGNAGVFADYARLPFSKFETMCQVPGMLLDTESPLSIQGRYVPNMLSYGIGYAKACLPKNYVQGRNALTQLLEVSPESDNTLFELTGAKDLVRHNGSLALLSTKDGFEKIKAGPMQERINHRVQLEFLTPQQIAELEPDLAGFYQGGVYYPNSRHTINPAGLCEQYAEYFQQQGGKIIRQDIRDITPKDTAVVLKTAEQQLSFDRLVVAAGVASRYLLEPLGIKLPLVSERGYHIELDYIAKELTRPVSWLDKSIFLTPMLNGIRVAGTAEFAYSDSPIDEKRVQHLLAFAKNMLGGEPKVRSEWVGSRPSTPDSLPIIGPLVKHPNIILAFGHGHVGLTLSSVTGQLVSQYINGEKTLVDLVMFSPSRF